MGQIIARKIYSGVTILVYPNRASGYTSIVNSGGAQQIHDLVRWCSEWNCNGKYGKFTKAISDTAEELIPKVTRTSKVDPSQDASVIQSRETVTEAYKSYYQNPDVNNRQNVKIAKEQLDQTYTVVHEELLTSKFDAVDQLPYKQSTGKAGY